MMKKLAIAVVALLASALTLSDQEALARAGGAQFGSHHLYYDTGHHRETYAEWAERNHHHDSD
jgi:hypothetical protein